MHSSGTGELVLLLYVDDSENDRLLVRETISLKNRLLSPFSAAVTHFYLA